MFLICALIALFFMVTPRPAFSKHPSIKYDGKLTIGIFPRRNMEQTFKMFQPLVDYIEQEIEMEVELVTARTYKDFRNKTQRGEVDLVHYSQSLYIDTSDMYEVFAQNKEFSMQAISSVIYVLKESGIDSIEDLKGKKIGLSNCNKELMNHVAPKQMLFKAGLWEADYTEVLQNNAIHSILGLYHGQTDAAFGNDHLLKLPEIRKLVDISKFKIISQGKPMSHFPWAVNKSLNQELKHKVKAALFSIKKSKHGNAILAAAGLTDITEAFDVDYLDQRLMMRGIEEQHSVYHLVE